MYTYFAGVKTIEELRQKYRELLKKYHPDNESGSVEITQEINAEYDAFKEVLNKIIHINLDMEIIGCWIWVHSGYEYKELLKSVGFKYAPKKKCWCWHYGDYVRYYKGEVSLEDIRIKYVL